MLSDLAFRLHAKEKKVIPRFLHLALSSQTVRRQMESSMRGSSGQFKISQRDLSKIEIPLATTKGQLRIVEAVSSVDNNIQSLERRITKLKYTTPGIAPTSFDHLTESTASLEHVADIRSGVTLGAEPSGDGTKEIPYLRVANVLDGRIDTSDVKTIRVITKDIDKYLLKEGDVLITEGGDLDKLGRGAVWEGEIDPCLHQNHVFRIRCGPEILPDYLSLYLSSQQGRDYFLKVGKQSTNLASVNATEVRRMPIPLPSIAEQERILDPVRSLRKMVSSLEAQVAKLRTIRKALVEDLVTGRVRVSEL